MVIPDWLGNPEAAPVVGGNPSIDSSAPLSAAVLAIRDAKRACVCRTRFIVLIFELIKDSSEYSPASTLFGSNLCRVLCLTERESVMSSELVAIRADCRDDATGIRGRPLARRASLCTAPHQSSVSSVESS